MSKVIINLLLLGAVLWANNSELPLVSPLNRYDDFHGKKIENVYLYTYIKDKETWKQVPFQIDEKDKDGDYFTKATGLIGKHDELVCMYDAFGDKASLKEWVDNSDAKKHPRYEISVKVNSEMKYLYLFYSETLTKENLNSYVSYKKENRLITTSLYSSGFNSQGILTNFSFAGDQNILDRSKFRNHFSISLLPDGMTIGEDDFKEKSYSYKVGDIRVIVKGVTEYKPPIGDAVEKENNYIFYQHFYHTNNGDITIENSGIAVMEYMRLSTDFNEKAQSLKRVYSSDETILTIDGKKDQFNKKIDNRISWIATGNESYSRVELHDIPLEVSEAREFYHFDNSTGGVGDKGEDSGDKKSFGDGGIALSKLKEGTYTFQNYTYIFKEPLSKDITQKTVELYKSNTNENVVKQDFSTAVTKDFGQKMFIKDIVLQNGSAIAIRNHAGHINVLDVVSVKGSLLYRLNKVPHKKVLIPLSHLSLSKSLVLFKLKGEFGQTIIPIRVQ